MSSSTAKQDREYLERVERDPDRLRDLTTDFLRLPAKHLSAVYEALQEGRWRTARDPRRYLKVVAMRIAQRMALEEQGGKRLISLSHRSPLVSEADFLEHLCPQGGMQRVNRVWKAKNDDYDESYREDELLHQLPSELRREELVWTPISNLDPNFSQPQNRGVVTERLDWKKIAEKAHLDPWMCRVLEYRVRGVSRAHALSEQKPANRKKLQAAWRRFDRRGRMQLLGFEQERA